MSSKIIAEKKEIKSIFSDFWFLIPAYQRSYVWDTDNIQDLLDDLWYAYEYKRDNEYFLGSIVLKKTEEKEFNEYEVLDGQQRLTTFFLLMAVLRDISVNKDLKDVCQKRIYQKANPYEGIPERIRIIYEIRDNVGGFIKEYILKNEGTLSAKIEEFIKSNNTSISHMANAIKDNKEIEEFAVFLGLKLVFIYVSTESREDAFRMFTILNNRGIPLTSADILKSTNIGEIANQKDQEKYAEKWEEIEGDLGKDFDRFLSFIRTIIVKEKARLSLLDEFEENIYKKELLKKGYETIDHIVLYKNIYNDIIKLKSDNLSNEYENLSNEYRNLINIMDIGLPSGDWIPPVLYFYKKFGDKKLLEFLKKVEFKFSSDWILQFTPTQRIENMNKILKGLEESQSADEILNQVKLFDVDKQYLKDVLERKDIYFRRYARYVLLKYEFLLGDNTAYLSKYEKKISVEHILPQTPKDNSQWKIDFTDDERTELTHTLGNLILINRKKNSALSNLDFSLKKEKYLNGQIDIFPSSKIFSQQNEWKPQSIRNRQKEMIEILLKN